ncbi:MAG: hypothetical protein AMS23_04600 [Bacteroides sp. SM1_62]|nr:MAG: hypothetical protein AMS26_11610 [Bacteroides sp. SM23_62]KPL25739.1 MAG: hypothetical protein AMS23_04600 [Bacteroides sp. SM1_62]
MKKIIFPFFAVLLITGCTPPKEEIDVAKEEEAIKAMLKKEVALWWERDVDAESNFWVKEDYFTTVSNSGNFHSQGHGWDSIFASIKRISVDTNWQYVSNARNEFKDFNIKVYDKVAWAVYYVDEAWEYKGEPYDRSFVRVTFLEKVDDNWKMALNAMTILNPCEEEDEDEENNDD